MALKWDVNAEKEGGKLAAKEDDWALAGVGDTVAKRTPKKWTFFGSHDTDSDLEREDTSVDSGSSSGNETEDEVKESKPGRTRVFPEVVALKNLIEKTQCASVMLVDQMLLSTWTP